MRNGQNGRRRGRGSNRPQQQGGGNRSAEVARQDARVRGNAQQLLEKYKNMARDAASSGDRILSEYYMQHADHYYRVLSEFRSRYEEQRPQERGYHDRDDLTRDDHGEDDHGEGDYDSELPQGDSGDPQYNRAMREHQQEPRAPAQRPAAEVPEISQAQPVEDAPQAEPDVAATEPPRRRRGRPRKTERVEPAATDA